MRNFTVKYSYFTIVVLIYFTIKLIRTPGVYSTLTDWYDPT